MNITYQVDVAPHMAREHYYRAKRERRWYQLHKHDGRAAFWRIAVPGLLLFWGLLAYSIHAI